MPYVRKRKYPYRTSRYRRSTPKFKRYRGLIPTYRGFAGPQQLKAEWKYVDVSATNVTPALDGANPVLLTPVAQGNSVNQRIGLRITIKSIEIRFAVQQKPGTLPGFFRISIVQDRQCNGELASYQTVYTYPNTVTLRNLGQRKRFKIIRDKVYPVQLHDTGNNVFMPHWYIKFKRPFTVEYNGGTTDQPSAIASNNLILYLIGSWIQGDITPSVTFLSRIRYTDV